MTRKALLSLIITMGLFFLLGIGENGWLKSLQAAECSQRKQDRLFRDPHALLGKLLPATEKAEAIAIAGLGACKIQVGAWESEFTPVTADKAAEFLVGDRKKNDASKELLPFRVVRKEGNDKIFLIALKGFRSAGGGFVVNDVRVLGLERTPGGWTWSSVIETNEKELDAVFSLNLVKGTSHRDLPLRQYRITTARGLFP